MMHVLSTIYKMTLWDLDKLRWPVNPILSDYDLIFYECVSGSYFHLYVLILSSCQWKYFSRHLAEAVSCTASTTGSRGRNRGQRQLSEDRGSSHNPRGESPFHQLVTLSSENWWDSLAREELKHLEKLRVGAGGCVPSHLENFSSCCIMNIYLVPCRACCFTFLFNTMLKLILLNLKHYFIWVFQILQVLFTTHSAQEQEWMKWGNFIHSQSPLSLIQ